MGPRALVLGWVLLLTFLPAAGAWGADAVFLENGVRIEGRAAEGQGDLTVIETPGGEITLPAWALDRSGEARARWERRKAFEDPKDPALAEELKRRQPLVRGAHTARTEAYAKYSPTDEKLRALAEALDAQGLADLAAGIEKDLPPEPGPAREYARELVEKANAGEAPDFSLLADAPPVTESKGAPDEKEAILKALRAFSFETRKATLRGAAIRKFVEDPEISRHVEDLARSKVAPTEDVKEAERLVKIWKQPPPPPPP